MRFAADAADTYPTDARDAPQRPRPAILPIAVTLVAGLLLGSSRAISWAGARPARWCHRPQARPRWNRALRPVHLRHRRRLRPMPVHARPPRRGQPASVPQASGSANGAGGWRNTGTLEAERLVRRTPPPAPAATWGRVVVRSSPAKASVTLNGRWRGRTPVTLDGLPFGHYVVRVVQPGYRAEQSEFALSAKDTARSLNVRLSREPAPASPSTTTHSTAKPETNPSGGYTGVLFIDSDAGRGGAAGCHGSGRRPCGCPTFGSAAMSCASSWRSIRRGRRRAA